MTIIKKKLCFLGLNARGGGGKSPSRRLFGPRAAQPRHIAALRAGLGAREGSGGLCRRGRDFRDAASYYELCAVMFFAGSLRGCEGGGVDEEYVVMWLIWMGLMEFGE